VNWTLGISVLSALAAVFSAAAAWRSARAAGGTLAESRRQHRLQVTPRVTAQVETVPIQGVPGYRCVTVRNRGRGGAFNVATSLQATCAGGQLEAVNANVAALAPTDDPVPVASNMAANYQEVSGAISYQDTEGTWHWSRCGEKSLHWEFGEGPAPAE